jgi:hypothetical protein
MVASWAAVNRKVLPFSGNIFKSCKRGIQGFYQVLEAVEDA